jgi:hypothetical protein
LRIRELYNILHNRDDETPFASLLVKRGEICHEVRRAPKDVADAFPLRRVQRSLRTRDRAAAYAAGARVRAEIEGQFAAARRRKGVTLDLLPTDDWTWPDWRALADWLEATLADDGCERASKIDPAEARPIRRLRRRSALGARAGPQS